MYADLADDSGFTRIKQQENPRQSAKICEQPSVAPGGARFFHARVHAHGLYDLEVDTAAQTPQECAHQIKQHLQTGPLPNAFRYLNQQHL